MAFSYFVLAVAAVATVLSSVSAVMLPKKAAGSVAMDEELRGLNMSGFRPIKTMGAFSGKENYF